MPETPATPATLPAIRVGKRIIVFCTDSCRSAYDGPTCSEVDEISTKLLRRRARCFICGAHLLPGSPGTFITAPPTANSLAEVLAIHCFLHQPTAPTAPTAEERMKGLREALAAAAATMGYDPARFGRPSLTEDEVKAVIAHYDSAVRAKGTMQAVVDNVDGEVQWAVMEAACEMGHSRAVVERDQDALFSAAGDYIERCQLEVNSIDLDALVAACRDLGLASWGEVSGGNVATIYAIRDDDTRKVTVVGGPGFYDGPARPRAWRKDFTVCTRSAGVDDDEEVEAGPFTDSSVDEIADLIAEALMTDTERLVRWLTDEVDRINEYLADCAGMLHPTTPALSARNAFLEVLRQLDSRHPSDLLPPLAHTPWATYWPPQP